MSKRVSHQLQHNITEDAYCKTHLEPTPLFCDDDQITLCSACVQSQEHKHHVVYGIQEAAENYRKLLQEILGTLKGKLEVAKSILADEQERMIMIQSVTSIPMRKEEEHNYKEMIESECRTRHLLLSEVNELNLQRLPGCTSDLNLRQASLNQLLRFAAELETSSQEILQRLSHLGRENMNKLKESEVRVSEQICSLQRVTAELEKNCGEPALAVLKNARYCLERGESLLLQPLEPAHITDLSLCQIPGMTQILRAFHRLITLDPRTAHPCLVLSEDLRRVRLGSVQQDLPGNPGRFDFGATVLGLESFTSGKHYWEVDVEKATKWQLGVYQDSANRKGTVPTASGDKVLLMGSMMGTDYTFWVFPPLKRVSLTKQMHKVGVFLDYECGHISFYNVTERTLIYNFSHLFFQGALRPIFCLCIPN